MTPGTLPLTWRQTTLGEVAAPVPNAIVDGPFGSNLKTSDYVEEGVPVLQGKNITNDSFRWFDVRFISDQKAAELKRSSVRVGDILVIKIGSIGYSAIVEDLNGFEFAIIPANLVKVTPDASKVDLVYLHKWLTSLDAKRYLISVASKTAQPALSLGKIKSLPLPLPPLTEQRRLAEVLDRAEALRAKRRAALAQLDALTQSLFLDLFGDPATNPKGWPISRVGEVADVQGGLQVTTARKDLPNEVPYLRVANVYRGFLNLNEIKTIRATDAEIARTKLVKDDLLIVEGHGNPAEIGRGALWDASIDGCINQNHIIRARFASAKVVPLYACEYLNSPGGRRHLLRAGKTTTGLNTISVSEVRGTPVTLPPISLQREFARRVTAVEKLKTAQRASLAELDALFATLQHRAFCGEL